MPYQKTKEGRLVNEITLGDGYPLSNDKQPLKVGGEASIINVSSPTPDGSVNGEVEVKGKLKAKDTIIQGDLKVFSDSDDQPQFVFQSKQGEQCFFKIQAGANNNAHLYLGNNQGDWILKRQTSTNSLQFSDGTNTPLTLDGDNVEFTNLTDGSITIDSFVDEDNMSSNSATKIPTQQSVKAYVDTEVAGLVDSAPAALDTLNELAAALNDDASFSTTITNSLATKLNLSGGSLTGAIDVTNSSQIGIDVESSFSGPSGVRVKRASGDSVSLLANYSGFGGGLSSTDALRFTVNDADANSISSPAMYIETNGRVGIGTTSPDDALDIGISGGNARIYFSGNAGGGGSGILYKDAGGAARYALNFEDDDKVILSNRASNGTVQIRANTSTAGAGGEQTIATFEDDQVSIDGNVGIGTTSPSNPLEVVAGENKGICVNRNATTTDSPVEVGFRHTTSDGDATTGMRSYRTNEDDSNDQELRFFTMAGSGGEGEHLTIKHNGNVGIGTTSPDATLEVNGAVHIQGGTYVNTNETKDDAALVLEENFNIYVAESGYLRNLISKENDVITLGQAPTNFVDEIRLIPGSSGFVSIYDGDGTTETIRLHGDGKIGIGTTSPATTLDVEGTVSYKHTAFTTAGPTDNVDVSDTTVLEVDTSSNNVVIGGFTGGVQGQILYIVKTHTANRLKLEHDESPAVGTHQKIYVTSGADETILGYGGWTLYCNGTNWHSLSNPTGTVDGG